MWEEWRSLFCINLRAAQPQRHLLQEDLIEDCLRDQGLVTQTVPANQELLFRRDDVLGPTGCRWRVLKDLAAAFRQACVQMSLQWLSRLLQGSVPVDSTPPHIQPTKANRVGQWAFQGTGSREREERKKKEESRDEEEDEGIFETYIIWIQDNTLIKLSRFFLLSTFYVEKRMTGDVFKGLFFLKKEDAGGNHSEVFVQMTIFLSSVLCLQCLPTQEDVAMGVPGLLGWAFCDWPGELFTV